jgi:hypothetical protein
MFRPLIVSALLLFGCQSTDIIEEAKNAQVREMRELCMNRVSNIERPNPVLRSQAIHQCHAWARSRVGL